MTSCGNGKIRNECAMGRKIRNVWFMGRNITIKGKVK